jgi:hypothetical protein
LKFRVIKKVPTSNAGNSIKNQIYVAWFSGEMKGRTTVPLISATAANLEMTVKGFLMCPVCSVMVFLEV